MRAFRVHRVLAFLALALGAALTAAPGCSSVLGLDELEGGSGALCDTLGRCSASVDRTVCEAHVTLRVAGLAAKTQLKWLEQLDDKNCVDTCNAARRCLDRNPICLAHGAACGAREECCGFAQGVADCDGRVGRCCSRLGVRCNSDGDCCLGAGACEPTTGTCGGVVCQLPGAGCNMGFECCSGICDAKTGTCAAETCFDDGFECAVDAECCSKVCDEASKTCVTPTCGVVGTPCDAKAGGGCCADLLCHVPEGGEGDLGVCSPGHCFPEQYDCSSHAQCCPLPGSKQKTGICDENFHLCRTTACVPIGGGCKNAIDCCEGTCFESTCQLCSTGVCDPGSANPKDGCCQPSDPKKPSVVCEAEVVGAPGLCRASCPAGCDHDVCTAGTPLLKGGCGDAAPCIDAVCVADPYCCCLAWDQACTNLVSTTAECAPCGL